MKKTCITPLLFVLLFVPGLAYAQVSGNANFGQPGGRAAAEQRERAKPVIAKDDHPPSATSMFVEANVLMNVRADQYVAVFAIAHDGESLADCARKMDATLKTFTDDIKALGIAGDDVFVDFIAQHKIYGFDVTGNIAKEKLVGFDLKKNVSIRYTDHSLLDKLTAAASRASFRPRQGRLHHQRPQQNPGQAGGRSGSHTQAEVVTIPETYGDHACSADAGLRRQVRDPLSHRAL